MSCEMKGTLFCRFFCVILLVILLNGWIFIPKAVNGVETPACTLTTKSLIIDYITSSLKTTAFLLLPYIRFTSHR